MYTFQTYAYFPSECINTKYILPFKTSHALILNFQIKTHPELFSFIGKSPRPYTENFVYTPFNKTILPHPNVMAQSLKLNSPHDFSAHSFPKGRAMCFDVYIYTTHLTHIYMENAQNTLSSFFS